MLNRRMKVKATYYSTAIKQKVLQYEYDIHC